LSWGPVASSTETWIRPLPGEAGAGEAEMLRARTLKVRSVLISPQSRRAEMLLLGAGCAQRADHEGVERCEGRNIL
jgi:hypothetical protein